MKVNVDKEVLDAAQKVINDRGVTMPLNLTLRAYQKKFENYTPTETVSIGERTFLVLDPQEGIGSETALLAFLQDLEQTNTLLLSKSLSEVPKTIYKQFGDLFPTQDDSIQFFQYILEKDFPSEEERQEAEDFIQNVKDMCSDEEYAELIEASTTAFNTAREKIKGVNKPLPLMLFIAAARQVSGPPIEAFTEQLEFPETIEEIRKYVISELVKLR